MKKIIRIENKWFLLFEEYFIEISNFNYENWIGEDIMSIKDDQIIYLYHANNIHNAVPWKIFTWCEFIRFFNKGAVN